MRPARVGVLVYLLIILSTFGCGLKRGAPESAEMEQATGEVTPEMVAEYAMIHQMSDLKTAEFYLTHPDYAKEHPYRPTPEDIAFYESKFLEQMYPSFKKLAEKEGYMKAMGRYRAIYGSGWKAKYRAAELRKKAELIEDKVMDATISYKDGYVDDAIEHMKIAVEAKPDSPKLLYNLGVMYMKKENYPEAVQCFQRSLEHIKSSGYTKINLMIHPKVYMSACTNLGLIYTRVGMYNEAVKVLKEAIQFKPDDLEANWNLGVAYWFMGNMEEIAAQIRRCINLDPGNAEAHNIIGLIYYRKELYSAALDEFRTAAKLHPNEKQYSYNEGLTLARLGRYDEASQAFERATGLVEGEELRRIFAEQLAANKVRKLYNDGCDAMGNLNLTRAVEFFEAALELKPDMAEAHVNLGFCYGKQGNTQKQIHHLEEAIRLKPDLPNVRCNLGSAYSDAKMYHRAIAELRRAIELEPSLRDAHFKLGMALCKTANYTDATPAFEKCLELSPNWFEAHLNLGTCYLKTENVDGAIDHFEKAAQLRPNSAEAHYDLGEAHIRMERFDEASALLQKALEIDPGYRQARIRLKDLEMYQHD